MDSLVTDRKAARVLASRALSIALIPTLGIALAAYILLQPSFEMWRGAELAAQSAGFDYVTPISGLRLWLWMGGGVLAFMLVWVIWATLIRKILWRGHVNSEIKRMRKNFSKDDKGPVPAIRLTPAEFEHEVARVIGAQTGLDTRVVGGAGDAGVDVLVYRSGKVVGVVQCKRYDPGKSLPPSHVREFKAVKDKYGVSAAYLVTTAYFTDASRHEAKLGGIKLIDGATFESMRQKAVASK